MLVTSLKDRTGDDMTHNLKGQGGNSRDVHIEWWKSESKMIYKSDSSDLMTGQLVRHPLVDEYKQS